VTEGQSLTKTLEIGGMTCQNCVRHVTAALSRLPGVRRVDVDLASKQATMDLEHDLDRSVLARALEAEGYQLI